MSDKLLTFKLLSNKWDNKKSKGHPRKPRVIEEHFFTDTVRFPGQSLEYKQIKKPLIKENVRSSSGPTAISPNCMFVGS